MEVVVKQCECVLWASVVVLAVCRLKRNVQKRVWGRFDTELTSKYGLVQGIADIVNEIYFAKGSKEKSCVLCTVVIDNFCDIQAWCGNWFSRGRGGIDINNRTHKITL